jgi:hypothetical protein
VRGFARPRGFPGGCGGFEARARRALRWPGGCDGEETKQRSEPRSKREHAMMIAFVMAIAGVAVLGTLNLIAAR